MGTPINCTNFWKAFSPLRLAVFRTVAKAAYVRAPQLDDLLVDKDLPFGEAFCVEVADSAYC
jgi:hypothetical protein